jgi:macrolide transport system ATP-binding/permease protein
MGELVTGNYSSDFHGSVVSIAIDLFIPVMMQPQLRGTDFLSARQSPLVWGLGRLPADQPLVAVAAGAEQLSQRLDAQQPARQVAQVATVIPMWRSPFGAQTYMLPAIGLLSVMGAMLPAMVCANVSNLVLVRGVSRRSEIAARVALGASRSRILRLLFVESVVLSLPSGVFGVLTARGIGTLLAGTNVDYAPPVPIYLDTSPDWIVVAFALLLAVGSALIFGFMPALRVSKVDLATIMKDDLSPRGGSRGRLRNALVVAQVAVSLLLLVGAGLVVRSLEAAKTANTGFDSRNVASVSLDLQPSGYGETTGRELYKKLLDIVRIEPGIESAALAAQLPLTLVDGNSLDSVIEGRESRPGEDMRFLVNNVSSDYLKTLRIALLSGRDFSVTDTPDSQPVVIVNETMARRFWGSPEQALGKRIQFGPDRGEASSAWRVTSSTRA